MNEPIKRDPEKKVSFQRSGKERPSFPGGAMRGVNRAQELQRNVPVGQAQKNKKQDTLAMKIIDIVVRFSIYITIFLLPLFFFTGVPSVLELNKQVLLVVIIGIGFLAWVGKMAWKNEIRFKKDFIMVPIVTFLAIFGLSTVLSNYFEQSMWGFFGGESLSFISLLFFVALFLLIYIAINTRKEALKVVLVFLGSGFLVSLYGMFQVWEIYTLSAEASKSPFFNSIGSVYVFSVYVGALFLLTLALFLSEMSKIFKIALVVLAFFFFFALMIINFKIVWIALIVCMALLFGITIMTGATSKNQSRVLPMIFLVLALLMVLRKQPIIRKELPVEVLLNYKTSAKIAFSSFKDSPLLGSGPATYATVYQQFRPDNLGDFWAVNFNNATSYFLTLMSTIGILGTLAFLFMIVVGLFYLFKTILKSVSDKEKGHKDYIAAGVGVVWLFTTIILFGYLANMSVLLLWWFTFALFLSFSLFGASEKPREFVTTSATPRSSLVLSFVFVLVIIGFVAAIYLQSQKYIASAHFSKALVSDSKGDDVQVVADRIGKAIESDPNRDLYFRNLSIAMFALANQRVAEKGQDLSADDSSYVSGMIRGALQAADQAKNLNPKDAENHLALAQMYEGVLITMDQADEKAIESYQEAIKLDPKNPVLHQRIANIYVTLSDVEVNRANAQAQANNQQIAELPEESKKYLALARESLDGALSIKTDFSAAILLSA